MSELAEKLLSTTDASVWAKEFMKVVESGAEIDEGFMIGWFANMWAATNDPLQTQLDIAISALQFVRAENIKILEQYHFVQPKDLISHTAINEAAEEIDGRLKEAINQIKEKAGE